MSENDTIRLNIDAAAAKRGADEFVKSVKRITTSATDLGTALGSMKGANFGKVAKDLATINSIKVSPALSKNVGDLSAALRGFRGPSSAAIKNTKSFISAINGIQVNPNVARSIAGVTAAMSGFRGPSSNSAKAIKEMLSALSSAKINGTTGANLASVTSVLSGFRGPSVAAARNINMIVQALNQLKTPPDLTGVTRAFLAMAASSGSAARSIRQLSSQHNANSSGMQKSSGAAMQLTGSMRGLENAMSFSYQMGSALRLLFGSLTFAEFTTGVYNATIAYQRFATTLKVGAKSQAEASQEMAFATQTADKYGISLTGVYDDYGKFSTAAKLAGQTSENVQYIFESMSGAMRVMGTDAMGQQRVFRSLTQMFSKGSVSAEELRQQLGEQLPAAFGLMQSALSKAAGKPVDLSKLLATGQVTDKAVLLLAEEVQRVFGPQIAESMERMDAQLTRLGNAWTKFQQRVGGGAVDKAIASVAKSLTDLMSSDAFMKNADAISEGLAKAIYVLGDAAQYALSHMKEIAAVMAAFATSTAIGSFVKIASSFRSLITLGAGFSSILGALPLAIGAATAALFYFWDETVKIGDATLSFGQIAQTVFKDLMDFATPIIDKIGGFGKALTESLATASLDPLIRQFADLDRVGQVALDNLLQQYGLTGDKIITLFKNVAKSIIAEMAKATFSIAASVRMAFDKLNASRDYYISSIWKDEADNLAEYNKKIADSIQENKENLELWKQIIDSFMDVGPNSSAAQENQKILDDMAAATKKHVEEADYLRQLDLNKAAAAEREKQRLAMQATQNDMQRPGGDVNPFKDPSKIDGTDKTSVGKRAREAQKAIADYRAELKDLLGDLNSGAISLAQFNAGLEYQARKLQENKDPYAAMVRSMQEEIDLQGMSSKAREREIAYRAKVNELAQKGVHLNEQQTATLREMIETQQEMNDRPLRDWVDGIEKVGLATDRVAVKAMEGLSDEIADLVVTGKADFASLAQSILKEFIKIGINQVYKQIFGGLGGTEKSPAMQQLSTPVGSANDAQKQVIGELFKDTDLRGGFGLKGDPTAVAAQQARVTAEQQFTSSLTSLKSTLDLYGNSASDAAGKFTTLSPSLDTTKGSVDSMGSSAMGAKSALDQLAASASSAMDKSVLNSQGLGNASGTAKMQGIDQSLSKAAPAYKPMPFVGSSAMSAGSNAAQAASDTFAQSFKAMDPKKLGSVLQARLMKDFGLKDFQAAGAVGNLSHETQGFTKLQEVNPKSGRGGLGLAQWTGPRRADFEKFAGANTADPETNYQFLKKELQTTEAASMAALKKTTSLEDATKSFQDNFERPGVEHFDRRLTAAQDVMRNQSIVKQSAPMMGNAGAQYDRIGGLMENKGIMQQVKGLTLHHTGGRGDPSSVVNTLNQRGLGVQYIMDRNGKIFQTGADAQIQSHMRNAQNGSGLSNANTLGMEVIAKNDADVTEAQRLAGVEWIKNMQAKYPGIGDNVYGHGELNRHKQETEGMSIVNAYRNQQQTPDMMPTGSIQQPQQVAGLDQLNTQLQTLGQTAQTAAQQTQTASQQQQTASQMETTAAQTAATASQTKVAADQQAGIAIQQAGAQAQQASPSFQQAGQSLASAGQAASQVQPQVGGFGDSLGMLMGPLSQAIPGVGQFGGVIMSLLSSLGGAGGGQGGGLLSSLFGLFKEGGVAGQAVSWGDMPHFREGGYMTGTNGMGGIPSVLHPNEAVIPLSRGRKIPVDLSGGSDIDAGSGGIRSGSGGSRPINVTIVAKDPNDFRASKRQIISTMASATQKTQIQDG